MVFVQGQGQGRHGDARPTGCAAYGMAGMGMPGLRSGVGY